jgi:hypothetical protein
VDRDAAEKRSEQDYNYTLTQVVDGEGGISGVLRIGLKLHTHTCGRWTGPMDRDVAEKRSE